MSVTLPTGDRDLRAERHSVGSNEQLKTGWTYSKKRICLRKWDWVHNKNLKEWNTWYKRWNRRGVQRVFQKHKAH